MPDVARRLAPAPTPTPVVAHLERRGGVAGGDTEFYQGQPTTYADGPPPSKFAINGSRGGAFGLLFGLLALVSIVGGGLWLLFIRRRNQRRRRARLAPMHAAFPARGRGAADDDFELAAGSDKPGHLSGGNEDAWKSTVSLGGGLDDSHLGVDESYRGRWAQSSESVNSEPPIDSTGKPEYSAVRGGQGAGGP